MLAVADELEWSGMTKETSKIAQTGCQAVPVTGELVSALHARRAIPVEQGHALPPVGYG